MEKDLVTRPEFDQFKKDFDAMRMELEQFQVKWRLFFGSDKFRQDRARKGAAARWAGHKAKRPRKPRVMTAETLANFNPFGGSDT